VKYQILRAACQAAIALPIGAIVADHGASIVDNA